MIVESFSIKPFSNTLAFSVDISFPLSTESWLGGKVGTLKRMPHNALVFANHQTMKL